MLLVVNPAHGQGPSCLAFSRDGSRIYTAGKDTVARVWDPEQGADQEPEAAQDSEEPVRTVAAGLDAWYAAGEDSEVRRYKNDRDFDGLVTSVPGLPINCVSINPKGTRAAVTSEETKVKVVDLVDTMNVILLEGGHNKGVRRATWHPSGTLLTTSGQDGKVVVWDVSEAEAKIVHTVEGVIPVVPDSESPEFAHDASVVWHNSGQYFFAATRSHEIVTVSRATWARTRTFSDDGVSGVITSLALSINGVYLASATASEVTIWSTATRRRLFHHPLSGNTVITQLAFSPTKNLLAWTDTEGNLTRWAKPISASSPDPVKYAAGMTTIQVKRPEDLFGMDTTEDDVAQDNDGDVDMGDMGDDWIIDDVPGVMVDEPYLGSMGRNSHVKEMVSITKAQPPFAPGSTPMDQKKRYLAYNMIGVIEVTDQDTHHIVNVEFHDRTARKGYHFTDNFKYDLGYLGERGALFACQPENDHPAQIQYKPYGTWTTQGDWSYDLPSGVVLGIAAGGFPPAKSMRQNSDGDLQGSGNVVVATTESDLTFLSGSGRERRIMGLGSDFVTMVAGREWVFVVYRAGSTTIDGSQNLSYKMINFDDFSVRQKDTLPIPKGHTLKWVGLSAEGAPAIYDSTGRVHVLTKFRIPQSASWARLLDTNTLERKQGKDESYWPVGISGETFNCLILKGRQEHPAFPRPLIQELPVRLPFRRPVKETSVMEEHVERETLLLDIAREFLDEELTTEDIQKREHAMDKEFIQLIQAACKTDNIPRAIELTKLLHHPGSFVTAAKVAEYYHLVGLQEKIWMLKADRDEAEDRLVVARNKRKQWMKPAPVLRQVADVETSTASRMKAFQDTRPPPQMPRPGLARATPRVETTRYSSVAPSTSAGPSQPSSPPAFSSVGSPDGKRKRDDLEDFSSSMPDEGNKRRAYEPEMPPPPLPKPKVNPFARKPAPEPASTSRNPFGRKPESASATKPLQKSESFFEKVDAIETDKRPVKRAGGKGKEKEKKADGAKQTTLFGYPSVGPPPKPQARTSKDSKTAPPKVAKDVGAIIGPSSSLAPVEDSMESFNGAMLEETQREDSQMEESQMDVVEPPLDISQTLEETQAVENEPPAGPEDCQSGGDTQPAEDEEDSTPVDWPLTP